MFYYVYVLQSRTDRNFYTGVTSDLRKRLQAHRYGGVKSTKDRRPLRLVYLEGSLSKKDAMERETYLKTAWGKRYIKNRIKHHLKRNAQAR